MSVICPACGAPKIDLAENCGNCRAMPRTAGGIPVLAPELMQVEDGFDSDTFADLAEVEMESFWFRGRSALILEFARRYFSNTRSLAEIGCGNGAVLSDLAKAFPDTEITAMDAHTQALALARKRIGRRAVLFQGDARRLPFQDEFDLLGAFDVIEHIVEDEAALACFHKALKPGGGILITVPAHMALWSSADEYSHHIRRYARKELLRKVEAARFEVLETASFVSLLAPALLAQRLLGNVRTVSKPQVTSLLPPFGLNALFGAIMTIERAIILKGFDLRFGGSLLLAARKPA